MQLGHTKAARPTESGVSGYHRIHLTVKEKNLVVQARDRGIIPLSRGSNPLPRLFAGILSAAHHAAHFPAANVFCWALAPESRAWTRAFCRASDAPIFPPMCAWSTTWSPACADKDGHIVGRPNARRLHRRRKGPRAAIGVFRAAQSGLPLTLGLVVDISGSLAQRDLTPSAPPPSSSSIRSCAMVPTGRSYWPSTAKSICSRI